MPGFEDAWIRIRRANAYFEALKKQIAEYRITHPNANGASIESDLNGNARVVAHVRERPPKEWGLASGDVLVDLRSALDYGVYALAIANGGKPIPDHAHRLEFPICEDDTAWKQAIGRHKLHGLSPNAVDYIRSVQPFGPDSGDALATMEELVGINKHRFVYVAWQRLHQIRLPMTLHNARIENFTGYSHPGELEDGAVLATFRIVSIDPANKAKVEVKPELVTAVVIEPTAKGWLDLGDFLGRLGPYVEYVVGQLEGFLVPGHEAPPRGTPIPLTPW